MANVTERIQSETLGPLLQVSHSDLREVGWLVKGVGGASGEDEVLERLERFRFFLDFFGMI